jgi:replicative DNA helicase
MEAIDTIILRQRNVEYVFAATAYTYPLYTISECGWLKPVIINDTGVKSFWQILTDAIDLTASDEEAATIAINAAMQAGIYKDLNRWSLDLPGQPMPQAFAKEIARRSYLQEMLLKNQELARALIDFDDEKAHRIVDEMATIRPGGGASKTGSAQSLHEQFMDALDAGEHNVLTHIPEIDAATGGLERKTETIIAARPSVGKTALMLQIARNVAAAGGKVDFYSLEMSGVNLWARAACGIAGVSWRDVRAGRIDDSKWTVLMQASIDLAEQYEGKLRIIDTTTTTEDIWQATAASKPDLILVDHLRYVRDTHNNEVKRQGLIAQRLKDIAKAYDCAVCVAAQLSRALEMRQDKRPILSDLRDSGEIEEVGDLIIGMYRDDLYNPQDYAGMRGQSATELWVRKFRDGPSNILINLNFNTKAQWFESKQK